MFMKQIHNSKTWKQIQYPLTDDWIRSMMYIYIMEYYSATKRWQNNASNNHIDRSRNAHTK